MCLLVDMDGIVVCQISTSFLITIHINHKVHGQQFIVRFKFKFKNRADIGGCAL